MDRGRQVERWIIVRQVTPVQLGLAGAAQLIIIIRTCTEKGKTTTARTYFVTSRPANQLSPSQILCLRRGQWGIEATCHQRLDVSLHEDQSRVRSLSGVAVLGLLSRISLALFQLSAPNRSATKPTRSGHSDSSDGPDPCWIASWSVVCRLDPSPPEHPAHTDDGTSAAALQKFCLQSPSERKKPRLHRPFQTGCLTQSSPVHLRAILESTVIAAMIEADIH